MSESQKIILQLKEEIKEEIKSSFSKNNFILDEEFLESIFNDFLEMNKNIDNISEARYFKQLWRKFDGENYNIRFDIDGSYLIILIKLKRRKIIKEYLRNV